MLYSNPTHSVWQISFFFHALLLIYNTGKNKPRYKKYAASRNVMYTINHNAIIKMYICMDEKLFTKLVLSRFMVCWHYTNLYTNVN